MALKAAWEEKSDNVIKKQDVRSRLLDMKKRKASDLNERRIKLAHILAEEDKQYELEFMASLETPEQVRAKMAEKLAVIKDQR